MAGKDITTLATEWLTQDWSTGVVLDQAQVTMQLVAATRFYAGYGTILSLVPNDSPSTLPTTTPVYTGINNLLPLFPITGYESNPLALPDTYEGQGNTPVPPVELSDITDATVLTGPEWAVIRPLFVLYVERQNALQLEASRELGLEVFGRSSSEIAGDVERMETEMPRKAFFQPILSI